MFPKSSNKENQNPNVMFVNIFLKSCLLWDYVEYLAEQARLRKTIEYGKKINFYAG
jgi:hypothetical protein